MRNNKPIQVFEHQHLPTDDTVFLQYSLGTYKSMGKNLYLVNSLEFNNLSFPINIVENDDGLILFDALLQEHTAKLTDGDRTH